MSGTTSGPDTFPEPKRTLWVKLGFGGTIKTNLLASQQPDIFIADVDTNQQRYKTSTGALNSNHGGPTDFVEIVPVAEQWTKPTIPDGNTQTTILDGTDIGPVHIWISVDVPDTYQIPADLASGDPSANNGDNPPTTNPPTTNPPPTDPPAGGLRPTPNTSTEQQLLDNLDTFAKQTSNPLIKGAVNYFANAVQLSIDIMNVGKDFSELADHPTDAWIQQTITDIGNTFGQYVIMESPFALLKPVNGAPIPKIEHWGIPSPSEVIRGDFVALAQIIGMGAKKIIGAAFDIEASIQHAAFNLAYPNITVKPNTIYDPTNPDTSRISNNLPVLQGVRLTLPSAEPTTNTGSNAPPIITPNGDIINQKFAPADYGSAANKLSIGLSSGLFFQGNTAAAAFIASDGFLRAPVQRSPIDPTSHLNSEIPQQINADGTYPITPETIGADFANVYISFVNNSGKFGAQEVVKLTLDLAKYTPNSDPAGAAQALNTLAVTEGVILGASTDKNVWLGLIKVIQYDLAHPSKPANPLASYVNDFVLNPTGQTGAGSVGRYLMDIKGGLTPAKAFTDTTGQPAAF